MNPKITIAICTYDNYKILSICLRSLLNQSCPRSFYEILVLDNTPQKDSVAKNECIDTCNTFGFIYLNKETNGLSGARNACIENCNTDLIHFIDDDTVLPANFIEESINCFYLDEGLAAFGGKVIPDWRFVDRPAWLGDDYLGFLSMVDFGNNKKVFGDGFHWLAGANICFKKSVFESYGFFDESLGRKGGTSSLLGAEENNLFRNMIKKEKVIYNPFSMLFHIVPPERVCQSWFIKRASWGVVSDILINCPWGSYSKDFLKDNAHLLLEEAQDEKAFGLRMKVAHELNYGLLKTGLS